MEFPVEEFLYIINQREENALAKLVIPTEWKIVYQKGNNFFGANLEGRRFTAATFGGAWVQARQYILDHARDCLNRPVDIYQGDAESGLYTEWSNKNSGLDFVTWLLYYEIENEMLRVEEV